LVSGNVHKPVAGVPFVVDSFLSVQVTAMICCSHTHGTGRNTHLWGMFSIALFSLVLEQLPPQAAPVALPVALLWRYITVHTSRESFQNSCIFVTRVVLHISKERHQHPVVRRVCTGQLLWIPLVLFKLVSSYH